MSSMLIVFLLMCYLTQAWFVGHYFWPLKKKGGAAVRGLVPISVVICVKNEAVNLKENLPSICVQDYPEFEILVMDDFSTDATAAVVKELQQTFPNIAYHHASKGLIDKRGKKWALHEARLLAKYDVLALTDADCKPLSNQWLRSLSAGLESGKKISLGIGQYTTDHSFLNKLIQYETLFTALSYLGFANRGEAYMGVGRNVLYDRRIIDAESPKFTNLVSGDDDVELQSFFTKSNTGIAIKKESQVISAPPKTFENWLTQKTRHYSTAPFYRKETKAKLFLLKCTFYLPNYLLIFAWVNGQEWLLTLLIFAVRWLIWWALWDSLRKRLFFTSRIYFLPCFELIFSIFDLWILAKNQTVKKHQWR